MPLTEAQRATYVEVIRDTFLDGCTDKAIYDAYHDLWADYGTGGGA